MRLLIIPILMFGLWSCDSANDPQGESRQSVEEGISTPYHVMRNADYRELTGCDVHSYDASIHTALRFLVFDEGSDTHNGGYARRHTRPLFQSFQSEDGSLDTACLPTWLRDIGQDMGILQPASTSEGEFSGEFAFDADAIDFPDAEGMTWEVLSRHDYMAATGCLLSPSSYELFHGALHDFLFTNWPERAPQSMATFLRDVRTSRPLDDETLDPECLTPGLLALGQEMGVLDGAGKMTQEFAAAEE